jgi:hypothetical protein
MTLMLKTLSKINRLFISKGVDLNSNSFNIVSVAYQLAGDEKRSIHAEVLTRPPSPWHNAPQAPGERSSPCDGARYDTSNFVYCASKAGNTYPKLWDNFNNVIKCL